MEYEEIIIQVNGKIYNRNFKIRSNMNSAEIHRFIIDYYANEIEGHKIIKGVVIPHRLVNLITE